MSQRPRILLTRRWTREVEQHLASLYDTALNESDVPLSTDALKAAMRDFRALLPTVDERHRRHRIRRGGRRGKVIRNFGVGFNHIDVAAARQHGIQVSNTPDVLTETTSELAILLLLIATRRAGEGE